MDHLLDLDRFAEKSAENLLQAIEKSKRTTLARLVYALGIRQVGEHMARLLAQSFGDLEGLMRASRQELEAIKEIGPETAESIVSFFEEAHNRTVIDKLKRAGVRYEPVRRKAAGALTGKTFVITGALKQYTRDEARSLVEARGGKVASAVSRKVTYVVVGEDPGSKYDQAAKLGVQMLTEAEFKKLLESGSPS